MSYGRQFGSAAEAYERWRFGYPEAVADAILAYADPPVATAIEIGAGTGKATRLIAARGIVVTAVEPDADMITVLTRAVATLPVTTIKSTFEDLDHEPVDLLFAAAAFHWTRDEGRWEQTAALLRPGGTFATFAAPLELVDPEVQRAVRRSMEHFTPIPTQTRRRPDDSGRNWPIPELEASNLFDDVTELRVARRLTVSADAYVHHAATNSGYLVLDPKTQQRALADLRVALSDPVELDADVILHLARRR